MSVSYLFMEPLTLPVTAEALGEDTVRNFTDAAAVRESLGTVFPDITWRSDPATASDLAQVLEDGVTYEFSLLDTRTEAGAAAGGGDVGLVVSLRCSGRVDSVPFVQRLCDQLGWLAFDQQVLMYQPHHAPVPA